MGKNKRLLFLISLFLLLTMVAAFTAMPVKATDSSGFPSITIESYTVGGVTTYYSGGSIPVGATIDFRVWVDLYNIDPVKIGYGDGTSDSVDFGGSFSYDFYHAYETAGTYVAEAFMPTDSGTFTGYSQPITVDESGTSGYSGVPTVTGIGPLDALINGVDITLSSIGGVFGLSGSNATAAGGGYNCSSSFWNNNGAHQDKGYKNCKQPSCISWRTINSTTAEVAGSRQTGHEGK